MFRPANADLNPEKLWSYELSYSQRLLQGRLSYGVNAFYIDGKDLIMRVPVDGRQMNVNTGKWRTAGVEAQVAYRLASAWSLDANYSYLHMDNPVLASPEHKLYAGAAFSKGRWYVSTGCQYVAGLYTEVKVAGQGDYADGRFCAVEFERFVPCFGVVEYLGERGKSFSPESTRLMRDSRCRKQR